VVAFKHFLRSSRCLQSRLELGKEVNEEENSRVERRRMLSRGEVESG